MNKTLAWIVGLVGLIFIIAAVIYFMTPANALPSFMPGHDATITKAHTKHGIGALFLGLACFAFTWFNSGKKKSKTSSEHEEK